jgi:hypothetical protein
MDFLRFSYDPNSWLDVLVFNVELLYQWFVHLMVLGGYVVFSM